MPRPRTADRDTTINAAAKAGKIRGADADHYRRMWDADPNSIRRLLTGRVEEGGLMPGLVRVEDGPPDGYDESWLSPAERDVAARTRASNPAPAPATAAPASAPTTAATATAGDDDEYESSWLSPDERDRIAAAKDGRPPAGPIDFEDGEARRAAGAGQ